VLLLKFLRTTSSEAVLCIENVKTFANLSSVSL